MKMPGQPYKTHLGLAAGDFDDCDVYYDYQPAESDTNTAESVEITDICFKDDVSMSDLSASEMADLETEILDYLGDWAQGYEEDKAEAMA